MINEPIILIKFWNLIAKRIPKFGKTMHKHHQRFTFIARFNVMQTNTLQVDLVLIFYLIKDRKNLQQFLTLIVVYLCVPYMGFARQTGGLI